MVFPIGDDRIKGGYKPIVSYSLIVLNVLCYIWQNTDPSGQFYVAEFGCIPAEIIRGVDLYTLFSSMFMHGGFLHLLGNVMFLWVFADNIEAVVGNGRFLVFYLVGGLAAGAVQILLNVGSTVPCVGASGAIAAVMGAYLVMYPKSRIMMLFVLNFSRFHIPALAFLGFWILQQLLSGIGALPFFGGNGVDGGGVAYWAHIGGFASGLIGGFFLKPAALRAQEAPGPEWPIWERST
jgi:membrane associated rhomboid family serine protease